jgi:predicted glycosyltransferase involved in capsule biosynthesis
MPEILGSGVSLLVPFRDDHAVGRAANWNRLRSHWQHFLPGAEIVEGDAPGVPFSKTCALNAAFRRSTGDVIVLLDADCLIDYQVILACADEIRKGRENNEPVWFVPYDRLFRLTEESTAAFIASPEGDPTIFGDPPSAEDIGPSSGSAAGHWFGALIQILPREAFVSIGGMDPRFRGWGGEDIVNLLTTDTLFAQHRMTRNKVLTLWHTAIGDNKLRTWVDQPKANSNGYLGTRYRAVLRDRQRMRRLVDEWQGDPTYSSDGLA